MSTLKWLRVILALAALPSTCLAKPMLSPSREAALGCRCIVVAEFMRVRGSYAPDAKPNFPGVTAEYRLIETLRGKPLLKAFLLHFDFQDGSACLAPEPWDFRKHLPRPGERQILFLSARPDSGECRTYRGDFGRWPAGDSVVSEVRRIVARADSARP